MKADTEQTVVTTVEARAVGSFDTIEHVDEKRAGEILGGSEPISARTMQRWRYVGEGPPFRKLGHFIRYSVCDLRAWSEAQRRLSTTES